MVSWNKPDYTYYVRCKMYITEQDTRDKEC